MATKKKQVLIRVQFDTYEKLKTISDRDYRSVSNQMEWAVLQFVEEYEKQNGVIPISRESNRSGVDNDFAAFGGSKFVN